MSNNQIRVQYSGFIIFTSQILSIATGLVFTLLLTRSMSTNEYGVWTLFFDFTSYFALFSGVLPFWATRFMARGKEGTVRTSTLAQMTIALVTLAVYFPAIILISGAIGTLPYLTIHLIAGFFLFNFYLIAILEAVLRSFRPQVIGYGLLIQEVVKVAIAVLLIVGLGQLFLGAILSLVLSGLVQVLYYLWLLRGKLKEMANWGYLKEWLKGSAAIAYSTVGGQLLSYTLFLLFFYGGSDARAYYQAAFTFTNVIGFSASLAFALYPRLLARTCPDDQVGVSFRTVLMLAIPLSTIAMVMSTSFLTILNVDYSIAWPVVIALTVDTLVVLIAQFYNTCLLGAEVFDVEGRVFLRQLVRSKIFKVFTVSYIQAAIALPLTYYVLTSMPLAGSVQATVSVIIISIAVHLSTFIGLYWFMRGSARIPVAWKSIAKYIFASILMGIALFLIPSPSTLILTVLKAILGLAIYIALLLAFDKQSRELVSIILEEIKGMLKQFSPRKLNS